MALRRTHSVTNRNVRLSPAREFLNRCFGGTPCKAGHHTFKSNSDLHPRKARVKHDFNASGGRLEHEVSAAWVIILQDFLGRLPTSKIRPLAEWPGPTNPARQSYKHFLKQLRKMLVITASLLLLLTFLLLYYLCTCHPPPDHHLGLSQPNSKFRLFH